MRMVLYKNRLISMLNLGKPQKSELKQLLKLFILIF